MFHKFHMKSSHDQILDQKKFYNFAIISNGINVFFYCESIKHRCVDPEKIYKH